MGSPKFNTPLKITSFINNNKMELEDGSWYKAMPAIPETWDVGDKITIKQQSPQRDGPKGKNFETMLTATKTDGSFVPVTPTSADSEPDQEVKRFDSVDDIEFDKKYLIEDVDSHSNITVGSRKFILNPLTVVKGKPENVDWQPGDTIVFLKGVSKNKNNITIENESRTNSNNPKLGFYFT